MDLIQEHSTEDLHKSLLAEIAKAQNEIRIAKKKLDVANGRLGFSVAVLNELINRGKD